MPVLLSNVERNESIPEELPCWGQFPSCHHFTSGWLRLMPLLSICVFLTFMVMLVHPKCPGKIYITDINCTFRFSDRRITYELGSSRVTFLRGDMESRILDEGNTIQRLDETTPLLRADSWRRKREATNHPTPATLSSKLIW